MTPVTLKPAAPRSQVRHSTTEPPRSHESVSHTCIKDPKPTHHYPITKAVIVLKSKVNLDPSEAPKLIFLTILPIGY